MKKCGLLTGNKMIMRFETEKNKTLKFALMFLYALSAMLGLGFYIRVHPAIALNLYRVFVPILFIIITPQLFFAFKHRLFSKLDIALFTVLATMILYGFVMFFLSEYVTSLKDSLKENLEVVLGIFSLAILITLIKNENDLLTFIDIVKVLFVCLLIFALFEIFTDIHLPLSRYSDYYLMQRLGYLPSVPFYSATTIFHNENDYSTYLVIFAPLFFANKKDSRFLFIVDCIILGLILFVLQINRAWICSVALIISVVFYLLVNNKSFLKNILKIILAVAIYQCVYFFAGILDPNFYHMKMGLLNELSGQQETASIGLGSMYRRLYTYFVSVKNMFVQTYGVGIGPGGFFNFLESLNDKDLLLSPHSMWVEILVEYGIILFLTFAACIIYLFYNVCVLFKNTKKEIYAQIICMVIAFVLASNAPSGFFGMDFMWIPIGLSMIASNLLILREKEKQNTYVFRKESY
ncbi:MAG TPA: O-antigen ligase family protein [Bacteroidales bacterium]|nr:O-antigen ligase family protein [Bacteroidales bacterium]HOG65994.1 O-antigen ligase family protein [Bacteroidales bacterium]